MKPELQPSQKDDGSGIAIFAEAREAGGGAGSARGGEKIVRRREWNHHVGFSRKPKK